MAVSLLNAVLLIKIFGISAQTDAYFICQAVIGALQMAQLLFVEQFMYFYNDLKVKSAASAHDFYGFSLFVAAVSGLSLLVLAAAGATPILNLFAHGLDPERMQILRKLFFMFSLTLAFNIAIFVNENLLNAEGHFSLPYIINILPSLFTLAALGYAWRYKDARVELLAGATVAASFAMCGTGLLLVKKTGIPLRLRTGHPAAKAFIRNSISMRFGHSIHNLLTPVITTNILSSLAAGFASQFSYAQKIIMILYSITTGPSIRILTSRISGLWSRRDLAGIKSSMNEYVKIAMPLLSISVIISYFLIPEALTVIGARNLSPLDISEIQFIFLCLSAWYLILASEAIFTTINIASKNSLVFIKGNSSFSLIYFCVAFGLRGRLGIYAIPAGLVTGQVVNLAYFSYCAFKLLRAGPAGSGTAVPGMEHFHG